MISFLSEAAYIVETNRRTQVAGNSGAELDHTTHTGRSMRSIDGFK